MKVRVALGHLANGNVNMKIHAEIKTPAASYFISESHVGVGPIEMGVPVPKRGSRSLNAAQLQVLKLPVGGSFMLTGHRLNEKYGLPSQVDEEAARLRAWAALRGLRLTMRKIDDNSHRIWRAA